MLEGPRRARMPVLRRESLQMWYYDSPNLLFNEDWNLYITPATYGGKWHAKGKSYSPLDVTGKFYGRLCEQFEAEAYRIEKGYYYCNCGFYRSDYTPTATEKKQIAELRAHASRYYARAERHYSK